MDEELVASFRADPEKLIGTFWICTTNLTLVYIAVDFHNGEIVLVDSGFHRRAVRVALGILLSSHCKYDLVDASWIKYGTLFTRGLRPFEAFGAVRSSIAATISVQWLPCQRQGSRALITEPMHLGYVLSHFRPLTQEELAICAPIYNRYLEYLDIQSLNEILFYEPPPPPPEKPVIGRSKWEILDGASENGTPNPDP